MPQTSSLARLQRFTLLLIGAAALGWALANGSGSPLRAVLGALAIAFSYTVLLALQFVLMRHAGPAAGHPLPTWGAMARAWIGESVQALRVFAWRQPFRWRDEPDSLPAQPGGPRGVILVHGFYCNRGFWKPWLQRLRASGRPFIAVNLEPVFTSIDAYAPLIDDAVRRMHAATGQAPWIVCHSMGGVVVRAWRRAAAQQPPVPPVHQVVTIGSPHAGTWIARFSHVPNGRQMRLLGEWVARLRDDEAWLAPPPPWVCWWSDCDNIVFPADTATLPFADNRLVRGSAHVALAFQPEVMDGTFALFDAEGRR